MVVDLCEGCSKFPVKLQGAMPTIPNQSDMKFGIQKPYLQYIVGMHYNYLLM